MEKHTRYFRYGHLKPETKPVEIADLDRHEAKAMLGKLALLLPEEIERAWYEVPLH